MTSIPTPSIATVSPSRPAHAAGRSARADGGVSAAALAASPWLEAWVGPDTAADHLLVLRSDSRGGCTLADPQSGWHEIQHFRSYEAAYDWLSQETYRLVDGRCAVP